MDTGSVVSGGHMSPIADKQARVESRIVKRKKKKRSTRPVPRQ
jgi:hypothetical protein